MTALKRMPNHQPISRMVRQLTPPEVPSNILLTATRSIRRNLAREGHELHAWRNLRNRVKITGSGQHYIPYPLQTTSMGN